ncbi:MAG: ABC transporter permease [Halanaerobiales bacterium]|nr:ABC transporter permease [Halanaerobiales bacterium]
MLSYIIRRILILIPMLLIITFLIYGGLELTPGDAVSYLVSPDVIANISPERLEELRESLGLNDPFIVRYFKWLGGVLKGDFGYSLTSGVPISKIVFDRLGATLELSIAALIFSSIVGGVLGTLSALYRGSIFDHFVTVVGMVGVSIPRFFFGLVSILIFSLTLKWLPAGGRIFPGYDTFFDRLPHLIMPAIVLGSTMTAGVMRYARSSMLDALNKEYIRTARSKGIPEWRVNLFHGLRVALTPVVVLIGFRLPMLIGGSVVIEQVFQWPGVGKEFISAVKGQNLPLIMMIALFSVLAVLIASLLVDIFTALLDPRVRLD